MYIVQRLDRNRFVFQFSLGLPIKQERCVFKRHLDKQQFNPHVVYIYRHLKGPSVNPYVGDFCSMFRFAELF